MFTRDGYDKSFSELKERLVERSTEDKASAVHFMRFEFPMAARNALLAGADLIAGIDHPEYEHRVDPVATEIRDALSQDFAAIN